MGGNYKGRRTVLVVKEKTVSTPDNTIGQICDKGQLLFILAPNKGQKRQKTAEYKVEETNPGAN